MNCLSMLGKTVAVLVLSGLASSVFAQWELMGDNSTVEFISTKNAAVAERHSFGSLSGSIDADGRVAVEIALVSVETLIPIRNERMREILFETANFPTASIAARVDAAVIKTAADGGVVVAEVPITLSLHGQEKDFSAPVVLVGTAGGGLMVVSSSPILLNAADFGLEKGVSLLQEVAGLKSISTAVPVSFKLLFVPSS
jgi:hypothetical protein